MGVTHTERDQPEEPEESGPIRPKTRQTGSGRQSSSSRSRRVHCDRISCHPTRQGRDSVVCGRHRITRPQADIRDGGKTAKDRDRPGDRRRLCGTANKNRAENLDDDHRGKRIGFDDLSTRASNCDRIPRFGCPPARGRQWCDEIWVRRWRLGFVQAEREAETACGPC